MNTIKINQSRRLLDDIFATSYNELQCDMADTLMAKSTHDGLSDEESQRQYPLLWQHFQFCPDCAEEYRMLVTLTHLEMTGQLQKPSRIPPIPGVTKPSLIKQIKEIIAKQFPGFQPALTLAIERGSGSLDMEPVEIELDMNYAVQFDLTPDEENTIYRHLYCTLLAEDDALVATNEGCSVWLQVSDGGIVQEGAIDELGDFAFFHIKPDDYLIGLSLSGQEYVISNISVP